MVMMSSRRRGFKHPRNATEFMAALDFVKTIKATFTVPELVQAGFKESTAQGWYTRGTLPDERSTAILKTLLQQKNTGRMQAC